MLTIDVVRDNADLRALEPEWSALSQRIGLEHPFVTHEWVRAWWEAFGDGAELHVLVVRRDSQCVAIAPLMRTQARMYGLAVRRLELTANLHTPRAEILAEPSAWDMVAEHLGAELDGWDVVMLPQLPEGSTTLAALDSLERRGFSVERWTAPASPFVRTNGDYDDYLRTIPRKHRSNLRNRQRRLERLGPVVYEIVRGGTDVEQALADGIRIEAAAWKGDAGTAIASSPAARRFYAQLADAAAARGWLELRFLTVGEQRVAFAYCLRYGRTLYLLKQGYDPAFAALAPASLLCDRMVRDCFEQGLAALDLLGRDESWKYTWTRETRPHAWWFAFSPRVRARLLRALKFTIVPALRDGPLGPLLQRAAE